MRVPRCGGRRATRQRQIFCICKSTIFKLCFLRGKQAPYKMGNPCGDSPTDRVSRLCEARAAARKNLSCRSCTSKYPSRSTHRGLCKTDTNPRWVRKVQACGMTVRESWAEEEADEPNQPLIVTVSPPSHRRDRGRLGGREMGLGWSATRSIAMNPGAGWMTNEIVGKALDRRKSNRLLNSRRCNTHSYH